MMKLAEPSRHDHFGSVLHLQINCLYFFLTLVYGISSCSDKENVYPTK
jgi:hypothetical protein